MTKTQLAVELSRLKTFQKPKMYLEQYPTDSEIAADMLWSAYMQGDIEGKVIADLGAGTGILGIGALILGAKKVFFVEKDKTAMVIAKENIENIGFSKEAEFVEADVKSFNEKVDVVIMNPPFGTKEKHADKEFLLQAFKIADVVYSFHKLETKEFIQKLAESNQVAITHFWTFKFPLRATMTHHKKKVEKIDVGCWRFKRKVYK